MAESRRNLVGKIQAYAAKRAKELKSIAETDLTVDTVEANIVGQKISFKANVERKAAWKLYVELYTRIATQELEQNRGSIREALTSLYNVFDITRGVLKEAGPAVAQGRESLGFYAMAILNQELRPFLVNWHRALSEWEVDKETKSSVVEHEQKWGRNAEFREELKLLQASLMQYCEALAALAGIS